MKRKIIPISHIKPNLTILDTKKHMYHLPSELLYIDNKHHSVRKSRGKKMINELNSRVYTWHSTPHQGCAISLCICTWTFFFSVIFRFDLGPGLRSIIFIIFFCCLVLFLYFLRSFYYFLLVFKCFFKIFKDVFINSRDKLLLQSDWYIQEVKKNN